MKKLVWLPFLNAHLCAYIALVSCDVVSDVTGYYPVSETADYTEDYVGGDGTILSQLCVELEQASKLSKSSNVRHVTIRIGRQFCIYLTGYYYVTVLPIPTRKLAMLCSARDVL